MIDDQHKSTQQAHDADESQNVTHESETQQESELQNEPAHPGKAEDGLSGAEHAEAHIQDHGAEESESGFNFDQLTGDAQLVELMMARREVDELKTQLKEVQLRALADVQNARRRAEQDVEKAHKFALDKFAQELLPVIDSLERAVETCPDNHEALKPVKEGVDMTLNLFISSIEKFNLLRLNPVGEVFNPELHQAMSMVDALDAKPNTVVAVMQKGYSLNGRLIRPAMVMVAKAR